MALATLSIDLVAQLAKLQHGMDQAVAMAEKRAASIESAFSKAGMAAGALLGGLGAAQMLQSGKAAIDLADRIDDLGEKYGVAAGSLSEYRYAAEVAGTPTDALASGMQKLSKAASEGNKGLALIGVSVKTASGDLKSTDTLLLEVADKFERFQDGPAKAALAMEIFGKSGADMLPMLNKGAAGIQSLRDEAKQLGAAFGDELARQAGELNDNLKRLQLASEGAKVSLMGDLLPSLISVTEELIAGRKAFGGYFAAAWAIGTGTSPFKGAGQNLKDITDEMAKVQAYIDEVARRASSKSVLDKFNNIGQDGKVDQAKERLEELKKLQGYLQEIQRSEALRGSGGVLDPRDALAQRGNAKVQAPALSDGRAAEEAAKQYDALISKIRQKQQEAQAELTTGQKLSEADKFRIDILSKLDSAESKLIPTQKDAVRALLSEAAASMAQAKAQEDLVKARKYSADLMERTNGAIDKESASLGESNKALQEQIRAYGLTADALEALTLARMDELIARQAELVGSAQNVEGNEAEAAALERKLQLMKRQRDLTAELQAKGATQRNDPFAGATKAVQDYMDKLAKAGETAKEVIGGALSTLESNLVDSLAQGKLDVSGFVTYVLREFLRLRVVQPLMKSLVSDAATAGVSGSGFLGALMSIFGFAKGGVFAGGVPVTAFASGGVVSTPTTFGMRNSLGLMGEAGPEAIVPLKRGSDGKLGVAGGGGTVVNNYNVAAGVSRSELMAALSMMGQSLKGEVFGALRQRGVM